MLEIKDLVNNFFIFICVVVIYSMTMTSFKRIEIRLTPAIKVTDPNAAFMNVHE